MFYLQWGLVWFFIWINGNVLLVAFLISIVNWEELMLAVYHKHIPWIIGYHKNVLSYDNVQFNGNIN